jgi:hypothetical protein
MLVVSHNPDFVDNLGVEREILLPAGDVSYYDKKEVEYFHEMDLIRQSKKSA